MFNGVRLQRMLQGDEKEDNLPWERAGSGRCWHVKAYVTTGVLTFVLQQRLPSIDLESDGFTPASCKRGGTIKRTRDDFRFKAHVINQLASSRKTPTSSGTPSIFPLSSLETFVKIDHNLISTWAKQEDSIVRLAADEVIGELLAVQQPKRWFPEAEKKIYGMSWGRRKKMLKVSIFTFRKLLEGIHPTDARAKSFRPSFRLVQRWAKRRSPSKRRRSNSKNEPVEERLPEIQRFKRDFDKLLKKPVRRRGAVFSDDESLSTGVRPGLRSSGNSS